jgi:hypothetical protein
MEFYGILRGGSGETSGSLVKLQTSIRLSSGGLNLKTFTLLNVSFPGVGVFENNSSRFWEKQYYVKNIYDELRKGKRIETGTMVQIKVDGQAHSGDISSLNLALLLSPLREAREGCFDNVCITGNVLFGSSPDDVWVEAVEDCEEKYNIAAQNEAFKKQNTTSVFVYVSHKKIEPKPGADNIKLLQIAPGQPIDALISRLLYGITYRPDQKEMFRAAVQQRIEDPLFQAEGRVYFEYYFTNPPAKKDRIVKTLFFFDLMHTMLEEGRDFSLLVRYPAPIDDSDLAGANDLVPKPAWYERLREEHSPDEAEEANDMVKFLKALINHEAEILHRLFFVYNKKEYKKISLNIDIREDRENRDLVDYHSENVLYIWHQDASGKKLEEYIISTSPEGLNFSHISKASGDEPRNILGGAQKKFGINNIKNIYAGKNFQMPPIILIGPPGIGKSTIMEKMKAYTNSKNLLSTDEFIYRYLYNDFGKNGIQAGFAPYTTQEFCYQAANLNALRKRREDFMEIWGLAEIMVLRMALSTGDLVDLDGKGICLNNIPRFLDTHFITVLLIPSLKEDEVRKNKEEEEFQEYVKIYRKRKDMLLGPNKGRKNIYHLMRISLCAAYDDLKKTFPKPECTLSSDVCPCWNDYTCCPHRRDEEAMWSEFTKRLKKEIWTRYNLYQRVADITVDVRAGSDIDKTVETVMLKARAYWDKVIEANRIPEGLWTE